MNPNRCPIKNCQFDRRLVLCPLHWDMVDPALKQTVYDLSIDLKEGTAEDSMDETVAKLTEVENEIIRRINERSL